MTKPWEKPTPLKVADVSGLLQQAEEHRSSGQLKDAERLARQVLSIWPGNAEAIEVLGLVALGAGNLERSIDYLREAARSPSAEPRYFSNLAEVCRLRGLLDEAEIAARRAVRMASNFGGGWNNLGIILQEAGKFEESRSALEQALQLAPRSAETHNNLANTLKNLSLLDEAERHWTKALELRPDYPEALSNMTVLLTEQGDYPKAESYGLKALKLNPRLHDAYVNLAALATACHNHEVALQLIDRLLSMEPLHSKGLTARASTLRQLDRVPEAYQTILRGLAAAPNDAELHLGLGTVLQAMGRLDDALVAFDRAVQLSPRIEERARVSYARMLVENGRSEEARVVLDDILIKYPQSALAWSNLADLHKFTADDHRIPMIEALLAAESTPSRGQRMLLHFSLGKAYLDGGNTDLAFEHLNAGNAMKRATLTYQSAENCRWMRNIADVFDANLLARLRGHGETSSMPIFVLGMPRSGTTLVEQILASHSAVRGAGELKYMHRIAQNLGAYPEAMRDLPAQRLKALGATYIDAVRPLAQGRTHVVDKMPSNFLYAGLINLILPDARIVHCRRDPVDTCLSCYSKLFADEQSFTYDMAELGAFYRAYSDVMDHWREVLPADRFIEVSYEDVVDDAEGQTRRLLEFLGLDWEDACLEFYKTDRPVRTASVNQVRQPVYRTSAGRWRKHASALAPLLEALGIDGKVASG